MADFVFNIAKGSIKKRIADGATLRALLLKVADADATLLDLDTVAAVLASGSTAEADFTNYARKTLASLTGAIDDTNNRATADAVDLVYTTAGGATNNTTAKLIIYDFITDDSSSIPLVALDCVFTTDGNDVTVVFNSVGFWKSE